MWRRSSYCSGGECVEVAWEKSTASSPEGNCVEVGWQKASESYANGGCVEVGTAKEGACGLIHVRDSKLGKESPVLDFTPAEWSAFVKGIQDGEPALVGPQVG